MKILIIVLSHNDSDIYSEFYKSQKETWDSVNVPDVETLYLFGNHSCDEIVGDKIMVDVPEVVKDNLIINCGYKTIKSFLGFDCRLTFCSTVV